jgi:hypothetical protein
MEGFDIHWEVANEGKGKESNTNICVYPLMIEMRHVAALCIPRVTWKISSIHWVCPWGQVSSQGLVP